MYDNIHYQKKKNPEANVTECQSFKIFIDE